MNGSVDPPEVTVHQEAIIVDRNAAIAVLKVSPVNLDLKTDRDYEAYHQVYQRILNTISYPVCIHSRQKRSDLSDYVEIISSNDSHPVLRSNYTEYCKQVAATGFVRTDHFVVVRVAGGEHEHPGRELSRRVHEIQSNLAGSGFKIFQVTGDELKRFAKQAFNPAPNPTEQYCATANDGFDEYRRLVYIKEYPSELEFGWPRHLFRVDGLVDVTQVFRPVGIDEAVRKLRRSSEKLDAAIGAYLKQGHKGVNKLERSLDDTEWFLDLLAKQECKPIQYGVYVTAHGPTRKAVDTTFDQLVTQLEALQLAFQEPGLRNDYAYFTDHPFYPDRLTETLLMPTVSAATGLPFGNQPLTGSDGILYGLDTEDGTPILIDRFEWDSHSTAVMGTLGSGKSYFTALELLRSILVYPDIQLIVVDPKKEYRQTVEALGGDHRFVIKGKDYSFDNQVVGFEVKNRGEFENVSALVDLVRQIYSATSKNQRRTIVVIDEARLLLKDEAGCHALNQFVLEARDINVAVHLVTQNRSHFAGSSNGREILKEIPGELFFRHEVAPDSPILSRQEEIDIQGLKSGEEANHSEGYLHISNGIHTKIKIESTPAEHRIIDGEKKR